MLRKTCLKQPEKKIQHFEPLKKKNTLYIVIMLHTIIIVSFALYPSPILFFELIIYYFVPKTIDKKNSLVKN